MLKDCIFILVKLPFLTDCYESHCYVTEYAPMCEDGIKREEIKPAIDFYRVIKWIEEAGYKKIEGALTIQEAFLQPFSVLRLFIYNQEHKLVNESRFERIDLVKEVYKKE